ncbi:6892_t:CDS:2 [Paraglomus brasilianum]|uniref:6892_t:CDS:1 n=1 Tax=Paraglomus brasilianum TaxID=144538 RepID=A0A9N9G5L8_9GLOM|nr:6892_t:CDS:2 [Paraglomus brasilianum]
MSFAPDFIYSTGLISKVNAVMSEIWSGFCGIIVVAALLYSERTSPKKVSFEDLSSIWTLYNEDEERSMTET